MNDRKVELEITARAEQAKEELRTTREEVDKLGGAAGAAVAPTGDLGERIRALSGSESAKSLAGLADELKRIREEGEKAGEALGGKEGDTEDGNSAAGGAVRAGKAFAYLQLAAFSAQSAAKLVKEFAADAGEAGEETKEWANDLSNLASSASRLDVIGTAASLGRLLANVFVDLTDQTISLADATAHLTKEQHAEVDALRRQLGLAQELAGEHREEVRNAGDRAAALRRLILEQEAQGGVQKYVRDEAQKLLDTFAKIGEQAPAEFLAVTAAVGILSTAQEKAAEDAEKLAERSAKAAERRAEAEEKAAARAAAALEKETLARQKAAAEQQKIVDEVMRGSKPDPAGDGAQGQELAAVTEEAAKLKAELQALEKIDTPLSVEQTNRIDELKNQIADLALKHHALSAAATVVRDDFISEADAARGAAAAMEVLGAVTAENQRIHEAALDSLEQLEGGYSDSTAELARLEKQAADAGNTLSGLFSEAKVVDPVREWERVVKEAEGQAGELGSTVTDTTEATEALGERGTVAVENLSGSVVGLRDALLEVEQLIDRLPAKVELLATALGKVRLPAADEAEAA